VGQRWLVAGNDEDEVGVEWLVDMGAQVGESEGLVGNGQSSGWGWLGREWLVEWLGLGLAGAARVVIEGRRGADQDGKSMGVGGHGADRIVAGKEGATQARSGQSKDKGRLGTSIQIELGRLG
jgi:hypothetical protein